MEVEELCAIEDENRGLAVGSVLVTIATVVVACVEGATVVISA